MGTAALVIGVVALVLAVLILFAPLGAFLGLVGLALGAELRSHSPASPSLRQRASHLAAVRWLTPAASAAAASDQPCRSIRWAISLRLFGQVRALAWSFIRCPPWDWWFRHLPASKGARMNNVVRNYN